MRGFAVRTITCAVVSQFLQSSVFGQYELANDIGVHVVRARCWWTFSHYGDVKMGTMASQITSLAIVYSTVCSGADQRKHQSTASLAFVRGIHRGPVNSPHKWPATRKCFHLMTSSWIHWPQRDVLTLIKIWLPKIAMKFISTSCEIARRRIPQNIFDD